MLPYLQWWCGFARQISPPLGNIYDHFLLPIAALRQFWCYRIAARFKPPANVARLEGQRSDGSCIHAAAKKSWSASDRGSYQPCVISPGRLRGRGYLHRRVKAAVPSRQMTIEQLTSREKECLRLLLTPMRAKEVARTTGLSVNTVNEHLKSARRKLGTSDSWSAALLLRALENPTKSSDTNKSGSRPTAFIHQKGGTEMSAPEPVMVERSRILPFATKGRPWNDLSFRWRLAWPFLLLGVIAVGAGTIMAVVSELSQLTIALTR